MLYWNEKKDLPLKEYCLKEYREFLKFNEDADCFIKLIENSLCDLKNFEKVNYARKFLSKDMLNSFIIVGELSFCLQKTLGSSVCKLKFSMDNMIKNKLIHPEITFFDYEKISKIIKKPSKFHKSKNGYDIILFKYDEKYYKLVVKTTKNKKENFIKSLHLLNKDRYNKY